ncbi:histidine kinase [Kineococcus xinjiangensis]|uniref:histidine kinase n=1 Tax=Kineococcus xinjiangensis TaxID=512762 RepID=A0A2S6IKB0_9ACTN|nr:histidine kinase [Kineococcus xinjiangensis]
MHGAARTARRDRWRFTTAAVVPSALALAALATALRHPDVEVLVDGHLLGGALMAVASAVVAAVLLQRVPAHPVGRCFAAIAWFDAASVCSGAVLISTSGSAGELAGWAAGWLWIPAVVLPVTVLPLVFPHSPPGRAAHLLLRTTLAAILVAMCAAAASPRVQVGPHEEVAGPFASSWAPPLQAIAVVVLVGCAILSTAALVVRLLRSDQRQRRQIAPFVVTGAAVVLVVLVAPRLGRAGTVLQDVAMLLVPVSAAVCILRLRLYDLEIVVQRAVAWTLLSAGIAVSYVVVVQAAATVFRLRGVGASVLATAVIAVGFAPARALLQDAVARWLYGDRGDPYAALTRTMQVLAGGADAIGALSAAAEDLARGLRCPGVRILGRGRVLAGFPDPAPERTPAGVLTVPLQHAGRRVGELEVRTRSPGEAFSPADLRLLDDLAVAIAGTVAAVAVAEELQASRSALLDARTEERRRLRSTLHDDIGPSLAAVCLQAETARRRLERADPRAALQVLHVLDTTTRRAVVDLRRVVDELAPATVTDLGLAAGVRALLDGAAAAGLRIHLDVDDLPELPAPLEATAYRVVAEALTNTLRHAAAQWIAVRITCPDALLVEVCDDGVGPGSTSRPGGLGLASMRARVEGHGGHLSVGSGGSGRRPGTVVRARLPLTAPAAPGSLLAAPRPAGSTS